MMDDGLHDFKAWYFSKPLFTRTFLAACVVETILISLNVVSPYALTYTFRKAFMNFELWRIFTAGIYMGNFGFMFIIDLMYAYQFLSKTESQLFSRATYADFIWLVLWAFVSLLLISSVFQLMIFTKSFIMCITYIYCKRRPHEQIRLMFGFTLKTGIFPFVYLAIMVLLGGSFYPLIIGIGLGHLYIFLKDIYSVKHNKDYLATPQFIKRWWYGRQGIRIPGVPGRPANQGFFNGGGVIIG